MRITYTSRLFFENGAVAKNVRVSVFDRDQPGKVDDDLTIQPGLTDDQGRFTVTYDTSRYQDSTVVTLTAPRNPPSDWTLETRASVVPDAQDTFQPYLKFNYQLSGSEYTASIDLNPKKREYKLPQPLPHDFQPAQHGFQFVNRFPGLFLPFALPPGLSQPNSIYGLCGGMSAGAADFLLAGRKIPQTSTVPTAGDPLHRYLYARQLDSLGAFGDVILRFMNWMSRPDGGPTGTQKLTLDEFEHKVRSRLNAFRPVVLGMLYVKWSDSREVWLNHQVLAHRYTRTSESVRIEIYDPNYPKRNDVFIEAVKTPSGFETTQYIGAQSKKMYGFFMITHQPILPPTDLT